MSHLGWPFNQIEAHHRVYLCNFVIATEPPRNIWNVLPSLSCWSWKSELYNASNVSINIVIVIVIVCHWYCWYCDGWGLPFAAVGHCLHHLHIIESRIVEEYAKHSKWKQPYFVKCSVCWKEGDDSEIAQYHELWLSLKKCVIWGRIGHWAGEQVAHHERQLLLKQALPSNITVPSSVTDCSTEDIFQKKSGTQAVLWASRPKSGQWKSALKGWKGGGRKIAPIVH